MEFVEFSKLISKKFAEMQKDNDVLYVLDVDRDEMWNFYLDAFPAGTNNIFKERREYDCSCCRNFIKNISNVVALKDDGSYITIWEVAAEGYFKAVADAMESYLKEFDVQSIFVSPENKYGALETYDSVNDINWNHYYTPVMAKFVKVRADIPSYIGSIDQTAQVFKRSMEEISSDAVKTVLELIAGKSIYRGDEFKKVVTDLQKFQNQYDKSTNKVGFIYQSVVKFGEYLKFRNTAIGTLLTDLSEGMDLEAAVKSFESKVAPSNYKRTSSLITEGMKKKAAERVEELGLTDALYRRHAVESDISINNVLFADRSAKLSDSPFDLIAPTSKKVKTFDKVQEVTADTFIKDILPGAESVEVYLENKHEANLVTLVAPKYEASGNLFKWDSNFSWTYNGDVTDSFMRKAVQERGGSVNGWLRFTHSWNHDGMNNSLMDLHVFSPKNKRHTACKGEEIHDSYGETHGARVGWNHRKDTTLGGVQDVDYTSHAPKDYIPVENITFDSLSKLPEGRWVFKIHNWDGTRLRNKSGFKAEIEINGDIYTYDHPKALKNKEWVTVATIDLKADGTYTIEHYAPLAGTASKEVWGVSTNQFVKASMVMKSPNFWDDQEIGNEHLFFMLEGCYNDQPVRGFFNEYLRSELYQDRKVFEVLGSKMMADPCKEQLSGVGFSSTMNSEVVVKVTGATQRTYKVVFNK